MTFINEDFLLQTESARHLYRRFAETQPIIDYHCHLSPSDIAEDRRFKNLAEIWLGHDHYKWRAMRANGIDERYCTGDAEPYEKYLAWAKTVPQTLRNPLYHWTHMELKRYFEIDELLDETTAPSIWRRANEFLASKEFSTQGLLKKLRVELVCTTDDPTDDLAPHKKIAEQKVTPRVYPTYRPDMALEVGKPEKFKAWVGRLEKAANVDIRNLKDFLEALRKRHDYFHSMGCRLSDHGLCFCSADLCPEATAAEIFAKACAGKAATPQEQSQFASFMMIFFGHLDAEKGWTKQLHIGARRNNVTRMSKRPDVGTDSIGDWSHVESLATYLDRLDQENALPKTILYNLNPADNYLFATMAQNFQDGTVPGKIQFGTGWWFLDQKEGMEWQINALSNTGLLSRFVGMVTDSRSCMSYPRHEYFRRILCNILGNDMEAGLIPDQEELVGKMVENICYFNASHYFGFKLPARESVREEAVSKGV
ncbi:MAG TPA: glucuronate isomerase [Terriglobales bacterium]|jgi:glucuronate isomerase|nr:glucuronate isomerase [Terriglobales bacterium]